MKICSQRLSPISLTLAIAVLAASHPGQARADIVSTGGTLTNVTPSTVSAGASSFAATHTTFVQPTGKVTDTSVSGTFGTQLTINTDAKTVYNSNGMLLAQGNATGTLGLDVTAPEAVSYNWLETQGFGYRGAGATGTLTLTNSGGAVVLGCTVTDTFGSPNPGGCEAGAAPNPNAPPPGLLRSGTLDLLAGNYTLSLDVASSHNTSQPLNVGYQFQLSPVPLPPALPLLLSGLAGLWTLGRNRRRAATPLHRG